MAIKKIKIGNTEHELQTTIANVDNLQTTLDGKYNSSGGNISGHVYLTGAKATSSTSNTSQIVFGTASDNHVALSSNNNALVINPDTATTARQIVLYLDKASVFPSGISANITGNLTGTATKATKDASGNVITSTYATKAELGSEVQSALSEAKASGEFKGDKGDKGDTGAAGVSISSVKQTTTSTADDGNNVITVTLSNGNTSTFTVQNGSKGSTGEQGVAGSNGKDGYTPVRGTDYWTAADKAEIKSYVDEAILGGAW